MRPALIAGIGGLVVGHVLWLIGISVATDGADVSYWVLVLSAVIAVLSVVVGLLAWRNYRRKRMVWAAFLGCMPVSPLIFTMIVLGVTHL